VYGATATNISPAYVLTRRNEHPRVGPNEWSPRRAAEPYVGSGAYFRIWRAITRRWIWLVPS
jgi:hypothetical protein